MGAFLLEVPDHEEEDVDYDLNKIKSMWQMITLLIVFVKFVALDGVLICARCLYHCDFLFHNVGVFMGVLKRAVSRCLIVMVSLGWGVVRDTLGATMPKIVFLGIFYVGTSVVRDFMVVIAVQDMETLSIEEEGELFDVVQILTFVVAAIDVVFILWILDALNGTMEYLESMNQTRKLMRYLRLRCLFLFTILFAVVWAVFSLVDTYDEDGILEEQHEWIVDAATELNYLFLLIGVAVLWWPNPSAKEYAYVMELPAVGGEDGENELELTGVVPSAMDDDDDDEGNAKRNGFHDDFEDEFSK